MAKKKQKYEAKPCKDDSQLGLEMKDKITGIKGIAVARVEYLTGCTQYHIRPQTVKDDKMASAVTFDYTQLDIISDGVIEKFKDIDNEPPGGVHPDCPLI